MGPADLFDRRPVPWTLSLSPSCHRCALGTFSQLVASTRAGSDHVAGIVGSCGLGLGASCAVTEASRTASRLPYRRGFESTVGLGNQLPHLDTVVQLLSRLPRSERLSLPHVLDLATRRVAWVFLCDQS